MAQKNNNKVSSVFIETALLKLINRKGKLHLSENVFVIIKKLLQKIYYKNDKKLLKTALLVVTPIILLIKIIQRKKPLTQIPFIVKKKNRLLIGIKHLLCLLKHKPQKSLKVSIIDEIILKIKEQYNKNNPRQVIYEYALTNKKYANYRWF